MKAPQAAAKLARLNNVEIRKLNVTLAKQKVKRKTKMTEGSEYSKTAPYCKN